MRVFRFETGCQRGELRLYGSHPDVWRHATDRVVEMAVAATGSDVEITRYPQLRAAGEVEPRRCDTDDLELLCVQFDGRSQNVRWRSEAVSPERVSYHHNGRPAGNVLLRPDVSTQHRRYLENLEQSIGDAGRRYGLCISDAGERELGRRVAREGHQCARFRCDVVNVGLRHRAPASAAAVGRPDRD
jgi:hypothetical protein